MTEFNCRLCSATCCLISIFSGKNREYRDIIRKLAYEILNVEMEGDVPVCICYSCIIQLYNCFIFKYRSQENDRICKIFQDQNKKPVKDQHKIIPIGELTIPDIDTLKATFTPWLQGKISIINEEQNSSTSSNRCDVSQKEVLMVDQSIQFSPSTVTRESQCDTKPQTFNITSHTVMEQKTVSTQCDNLIEKVNVRTQTKLKTKNVGIQCDKIHGTIEKNEVAPSSNKFKNRYIQCEIPKKIDCGVQVVATLLKDKYVQCFLKPDMIEKECQHEDSEKYTTFTQTDMNPDNQGSVKLLMEILRNTDLGRSLYIYGKTKFGNGVNEISEIELNNLKNAMEAKLQFLGNAGLTLNAPLSFYQESNILNSNTKREAMFRKRKSSRDNNHVVNSSVQCDIKKDSPEIIDASTQTIFDTETKMKFEMFSPTISPTKSLNMSVDLSHKTEPTSSPIVGTPTSRHLNLLTVCEKVNFVQICKECDLSMYSRTEAMKHRRLHRTCKLCKQKFRSVKQTKEHLKTQCDVKLRMIPVVNILKMDRHTFNNRLKLQQDYYTTSNMNHLDSKNVPPAKRLKLC